MNTYRIYSMKSSGYMCWFHIFFGIASFFVQPNSLVASEPKISFVNDVIPVITRAGCNMGSCHAKAGGGQNGFQLSLLGFEPLEDLESIVMGSRGRRLLVTNPESSLLLMKASGQMPHRGGVRLPKKSQGYEIIKTWITQGALLDASTDVKFVAMELIPKKGALQRGQEQQLKAMAHYSDGTIHDVTARALFESNDKAMAEVTENGLVKVLDIPGKVSVMVRYQGNVAVYNASIPLGAPVENLPPEKNFIDTRSF